MTKKLHFAMLTSLLVLENEVRLQISKKNLAYT